MNILTYLTKLYYYFEQKKKKKYIEELISKGLKLGQNVEIIDTFFFDPSHCFLISIGNNSTICPNVRLIAHDASTKKLLGYTKIGRIQIKENWVNATHPSAGFTQMQAPGTIIYIVGNIYLYYPILRISGQLHP